MSNHKIELTNWANELPYSTADISRQQAILLRKGCSAGIIEQGDERYHVPTHTAMGTYHKQVASALAVLLNRIVLIGYDALTENEKKAHQQWREAYDNEKPFRPDWFEFYKLCKPNPTNSGIAGIGLRYSR